VNHPRRTRPPASPRPRLARARHLALIGATSGVAALALSACSSAGSSQATTTAATYTVATADVPGVGTVLTNGAGRTFYILSSEAGGKLTCTDANGCTAVWPDTELPAGMTSGVAGSGVQASVLGTVRSAEGKLYLSYGGWPLYTYTGDSGPHQSNGQGVNSFGGTWTAITVAGQAAAAH
jgi:predicted lipoprotein with Yx(FWY)xxD motif